MFLSMLKMVGNFNLQQRIKYALHFCADPQHVIITTLSQQLYYCSCGRPSPLCTHALGTCTKFQLEIPKEIKIKEDLRSIGLGWRLVTASHM